MTAKEKAKELYDLFVPQVRWKLGQEDYKDRAKQCALITVDKVIESREEDKGFNDTLLSTASEYWTAHPMYLTYWKKVKQEIERL